MSMRYAGETASAFIPIINEQGYRQVVGGVDQGNGLAAMLVTGSFAVATQSTTQVTTQVAPSTSVQTIADQNLYRVGLTIYNASSGYLFLSLSPTGTPYSYVVPSSSNFTLPLAYTGAIYGIFSSNQGDDVVITDFSP